MATASKKSAASSAKTTAAPATAAKKPTASKTAAKPSTAAKAEAKPTAKAVRAVKAVESKPAAKAVSPAKKTVKASPAAAPAKRASKAASPVAAPVSAKPAAKAAAKPAAVKAAAPVKAAAAKVKAASVATPAVKAPAKKKAVAAVAPAKTTAAGKKAAAAAPVKAVKTAVKAMAKAPVEALAKAPVKAAVKKPVEKATTKAVEPISKKTAAKKSAAPVVPEAAAVPAKKKPAAKQSAKPAVAAVVAAAPVAAPAPAPSAPSKAKAKPKAQAAAPAAVSPAKPKSSATGAAPKGKSAAKQADKQTQLAAAPVAAPASAPVAAPQPPKAPARFSLQAEDASSHFGAYRVTSLSDAAAHWQVTVHGAQAIDCRCSCAGFAFSNRGACEHIDFVLDELLSQPEAAQVLRQGWHADYSEVLLRFGARRQLRWRQGRACPDALAEAAQAMLDENGRLRAEAPGALSQLLNLAATLGHDLRVEEGVWPLLAHRRDAAQRVERLEQAYPQGLASPALHGLLKLPLPIYQLEAALFAVCAGRSLVADDLGLGLHAQALAAAELLMRHMGVERVLVLAEAAGLPRWQAEAQTLSPRGVQMLQAGAAPSAAEIGIASHAALTQDLTPLQAFAPELIIVDDAALLDEQMLSQLKQLDQGFLLLLSGELLNQRPKALLPLVELLDRQRSGPYARFLSYHAKRDQEGRVQGFVALDALDQTLERLMFARSRADLLATLPPALLQLRKVSMSAQQQDAQAGLWQGLRRAVQRWQRSDYVSDAELLQITQQLQALRRVAISPQLLAGASAVVSADASADGADLASPKLAAVVEVARELLGRAAARLVLFCQWDDALALAVAPLQAAGFKLLHLHDGQSLVQRQHQARRWRDDASLQILLCSDAAAAGLDLHIDAAGEGAAADLGLGLINLELPWGEALLEQRLASASREDSAGLPMIQLIAQPGLEQQMLLALDRLPELPPCSLDGDIARRLMQGEELRAFMQALALMLPEAQ
ncbi:SNF2-related protein [Roseateles sp. PN1]|uniref:SNF2-related protein n=1 Tax=Roseateles sp. PN1 TaxID=3137372 RepID=UPI003138CC44